MDEQELKELLAIIVGSLENDYDAMDKIISFCPKCWESEMRELLNYY